MGEEETGSMSNSLMMFYYKREQSYGSVTEEGQGGLCMFKIRDGTAC